MKTLTNGQGTTWTHVSWYEYNKLVEEGKTRHHHDLKCNFAHEVEIDGAVYTEDNFAKAKRYTWEQGRGYTNYYFMADNGDVLVIHR